MKRLLSFVLLTSCFLLVSFTGRKNKSPEKCFKKIYSVDDLNSHKNNIYSILNRPDDLWMGTESGGLAYINSELTYRYDPSNSGIPGVRINSVINVNDTLWIGTNNGLVCLWRDDDFDIWNVYNTDNSGLAHNHIHHIFQDDFGKIWMGTGNEGVTLYDHGKWANYNVSNSGIPGGVVYSIEQDNVGNIWFGTQDGGLGKLNSETQEWEVYQVTNSDLPDNWVSALSYDSDNDKMWIGTLGGGLVALKNNNFEIYSSDNSPLPNNSVMDLLLDSKGIWVATGGGGFALLGKSGNWLVNNQETTGLEIDFVLSLASDNKGNKGLGVWKKGYYLYNENGI